jgi:xanthosine utilization system XapX-like protein
VEIWSSVLIAGVILSASAGLLVGHVRAWRRAQAGPLEPAERDYRRRQFRRRMQCSSMMGSLAIAIVVGRLLMLIPAPPLVIFVFWCVVVLLVGWILLLALVDMWATKHYFARLHEHCLIERAKLQVELRRLQEKESNGRSRQRH